MKSSNPKDAIASNKIPYHLIPATALAHTAVAAHEGNAKYGAHNYSVEGSRASVYVAAAQRHINAWNMGETLATDSKAHHLAHAIMCLAILIDNEERGILVDDRPPSFDLAALHTQLEETIAAITARHADKNPRHYTIADSRPAGKVKPTPLEQMADRFPKEMETYPGGFPAAQRRTDKIAAAVATGHLVAFDLVTGNCIETETRQVTTASEAHPVFPENVAADPTPRYETEVLLNDDGSAYVKASSKENSDA